MTQVFRLFLSCIVLFVLAFPAYSQKVGIFYFVWHGAHGYDTHRGGIPSEGIMPKLPSDTLSPYDISKLLKQNPGKPAYGPLHAFHHWAEPYFGYYLADDEWVIRKHGQMLADAGVDVIILDATNGAIYLPQFMKIAETYQKMRAAGSKTPEIAFIVNSSPVATVNRLYESIYSKGLYRNLWFNWKGKPLLLAPSEGQSDDVKSFFTLRQSWAWSKGQTWFADGKDKWPWLDHAPQSYGWHESPDKAEQVSVSIAQHPMSNIGRSYRKGKQPKVPDPGAGLYFSEQWKRALQVKPEFVFITGWNEWVAMRFNDGASSHFLGKRIPKGDTYFVDLYNEEFSRDAEPMKGGFADSYYLQMVDHIKKYKAQADVPVYRATNRIKVDGRFGDWSEVAAVYRDDTGDIFHRDHPGWGRYQRYVDTSGRNDITETRVAVDSRFVYFYVRTAGRLSAPGAGDWMQLLISDQSGAANWEGFQYRVVNHPSKTGIKRILKSMGGWNWQPVAEVKYRWLNNEMELGIPRKLLPGIAEVQLEFKWADHIPEDGDPMHFYDKGDVAPNARFKYVYKFVP
ncbi:hypothetical protein [Pedobacter faecalis]|uniref:hypothetical protein n=1 Tax=Pedobacter faecalis TaxID=3041495 RepID=UPI00255043CD|nr:hypothetical protein [Pedobacter sp. ELA7]